MMGSPAFWRQLQVAIIVNLNSINYGLLVGWPSPAQPMLQSDVTPAIGPEPFTDGMMSWATSLSYLGAFIGSCFWAQLANQIGRKNTSLLICVPYIICWSMMTFTDSVICVYIARIFGGLGNSGTIINCPMYVAETCTAKLRDRLGTLLTSSACFGVLVVYINGSIFPYRVFNAINLLAAIITLLLTLYLPESPIFHLKNSKVNEASRALVWLRAYDENNAKDKDALDDDVQTLKSTFLNYEKKSKFRDILIPSTRNAILVAFGLMSAIQMCGITVILTNAVYMFQSSVRKGPVTERSLPSTIDPMNFTTSLDFNSTTSFSNSSTLHLQSSATSFVLTPARSSIIIAFLQLVASYVSILIVNRAGRKKLLLISYSVLAATLFILGAFFYVRDMNFTHSAYLQLVPVISLSLYIVAYTSAACPVSFIILTEIFPAETRNACMCLVMVYMHLIMFVMVKLFVHTREWIGMHGCMWLYSGSTVAVSLFNYLIVPETRGRDFMDVVKDLNFSK